MDPKDRDGEKSHNYYGDDRDKGSRHHHPKRDRDTQEYSRPWNRRGEDRGFRRGGWNQGGYKNNSRHRYEDNNPRRQNRDRDRSERSEDRNKEERRSRSPSGDRSRESSDNRRDQDSQARPGDRSHNSYGRNRGNSDRPWSKSGGNSAAGSSKAASSADTKDVEADDIDEEDLKPVSLNISCPAASSLVKQIEARKMLFSKKDKPVESAAPTTSVWQQTTFSDDSDGKVSAKFKRLMGIKNPKGSESQPPKSPPGTQSKEFFVNLEKQYEVARTITHTQRGVGLGFSSAGGSSVLLKPAAPSNSHTYFK